MNFFDAFLNNQVIEVSFLSWFAAQFLKVMLTLIFEKKLNLYRMVGSGGMPSSHSSTVMGLSTTVGLLYGWNSAIFGVCLIFSVIVMYDAAGVRQSVGKQAIILNTMLDDLYQHRPIREERLKELVGHTKVEVFAGALLGILLANLLV